MRMRFTKDEKAAFTPGAQVEWRNGRYWYPGTVLHAPVLADGMKIWHTVVRNDGPTTRTVSHGHVVHAIPTYVRVPASKVTEF